MSIYISPRQGIKELTSKLEAGLTALARSMRQQPERMRVDAAYHIPFRDQASVDDKKSVPVADLQGADGIEQVIAGLTAIRISLGLQNPRETLRAPGAVALPKEWIQTLREINALKAEIEQLIGLIPDQVHRTEIWAADSTLSGLQTMRQTWIIDTPKTIRFYWDAAPSIKQSIAGELVASYSKRLNKYYGHIPALGELDEGDSNLKYVYGLAALKDIPAKEQLAIYREGKPHVRARIAFLDKIPAVIRPSPTPIVYETGDLVPTIIPLLSWEPTENEEVGGGGERSKRARIEDIPLEASLYLYRYLRPHRKSV